MKQENCFMTTVQLQPITISYGIEVSSYQSSNDL